jgi:uncharacterized protein (DUF433 family)
MKQAVTTSNPNIADWGGTFVADKAFPAITIHPARMNGTPTIAGTQTTVASLLDALSDGMSLHDFIAEHDELSLSDGEAVLLALRDAVEELALR